MKITDVRTFLLSYPYTEEESWEVSGFRVLQRNAAIIEITTDEGVTGVGEADIELGPVGAVPAAIDQGFKGLLIGENPLNIEKLWHKMYASSLPWGRKGFAIVVISGIEIALWDIVGKIRNSPVYALLGGAYHDKMRVYAGAGMLRPIDEMIKEASRYVDEGYTALKVRIGYGLEKDVEIIKAIREAIGYDVDLMADAGQGYVNEPWDAVTALKLAKRLEPYHLFWLEEPCHPDDIDGYALLKRNSGIPIAGGENEYTRFGFKELFVKKAVDIVQPDVTRCGGIWECKKIAAIASAFQIRCAPHAGGGVALMANLHFAISTSNCIILEYDRTIDPLRDELLIEPPKIHNGYIDLPHNPGLGVKLTKETIEKFPFRPGPAIRRK